MERPNRSNDELAETTEERPKAADPIHHGDDDQPVAANPEVESLADNLEPEAEADLRKW